MFGFGAQELIIVLLIVLVLFGASRLPELGRGMGSFIKNFKKATTEPDEIDVTPDKKVEGKPEEKQEAEEKKEGE
jgi:sec-independent protein translocase protein TatA